MGASARLRQSRLTVRGRTRRPRHPPVGPREGKRSQGGGGGGAVAIGASPTFLRCGCEGGEMAAKESGPRSVCAGSAVALEIENIKHYHVPLLFHGVFV